MILDINILCQLYILNYMVYYKYNNVFLYEVNIYININLLHRKLLLVFLYVRSCCIKDLNSYIQVRIGIQLKVKKQQVYKYTLTG